MRIKRASKERRTSADGQIFDSIGELKRWEQLKLLQKSGEIFDLRRQVVFPLEINGTPVVIRSPGFPNGRPCKYKSDFSYYDTRCRDVLTIEDYKGVDTDAARLRRAVVEAIYGFRILLTGPAKMPPRKRLKWK